MSPPVVWGEEVGNRLRALWADIDVPRAEIASRLGVDEGVLRYLIRRLKLGRRSPHPKSRRYRKANGLTASRRRWGEHELATLVAMRADTTWSDADIGAAMGRSRQSVANMACRMKLPTRATSDGKRGLTGRPAQEAAHAAKKDGALRWAQAQNLDELARRRPTLPTKPPLPNRIDVARELLRRGIAPDTVARGYGLTPAELADLTAAHHRHAQAA